METAAQRHARIKAADKAAGVVSRLRDGNTLFTRYADRVTVCEFGTPASRGTPERPLTSAERTRWALLALEGRYL
jgi:ABC-type hemin transport system ATPase subunit